MGRPRWWRTATLDEQAAEDAADLALVASRMATDNGNRTSLDDVMAELGITQADVDALPPEPLTMDELRERYSSGG